MLPKFATRRVGEHLVVSVTDTGGARSPSLLGEHLAADNEATWSRHVIADLSPLTLLEAHDVDALTSAYWRVTNQGTWFSVVAPHHEVRDVLMSASLDWLIPICSSLPEALGQPTEPGPAEGPDRHRQPAQQRELPPQTSRFSN